MDKPWQKGFKRILFWMGMNDGSRARESTRTTLSISWRPAMTVHLFLDKTDNQKKENIVKEMTKYITGDSSKTPTRCPTINVPRKVSIHTKHYKKCIMALLYSIFSISEFWEWSTWKKERSKRRTEEMSILSFSLSRRCLSECCDKHVPSSSIKWNDKLFCIEFHHAIDRRKFRLCAFDSPVKCLSFG